MQTARVSVVRGVVFLFAHVVVVGGTAQEATGTPAASEVPRLKGIADLHVHMASNRAFGGDWMQGSEKGAIFGLDERGRPVSRIQERPAEKPKYDSDDHQLAYVEYLKRAWEHGLRLMVFMTVDAQWFCKVNCGPFHFNDACRKYRCGGNAGWNYYTQSMLRQIKDAKAIEQLAGEWFKIVYSPEEARVAIQAGKLAVVLGVEMARPFDCGQAGGLCANRMSPKEAIDFAYANGVRYVYPIHGIDNLFGGTAVFRDGYNSMSNDANSRYLDVESCRKPDIDFVFRGTQGLYAETGGNYGASLGSTPGWPECLFRIKTYAPTFGAEAGCSVLPVPHELSLAVLGYDALTAIPVVGWVFQALKGLALWILGCPQPLFTRWVVNCTKGGLCNKKGLSLKGNAFVQDLMRKGMLIDTDHMSSKAFADAVRLATSESDLRAVGRNKPYPLISGHTTFRSLGNTPDGIVKAGRTIVHNGEHLVRSETWRSDEEIVALRKTGGMIAPIVIQERNNDFKGELYEANGKLFIGNPDGLLRGRDGSAPTYRDRSVRPVRVKNDCATSSKAWAQVYLKAVELMGGENVAIGSDVNGRAPLAASRFGDRACWQGKLNEADRANEVKAQRDRLDYANGSYHVSRVFRDRDKGRLSAPTWDGTSYDYNTDGFAHYGLLPDFIADLEGVGVPPAALDVLFDSAEAFVRVWEKAQPTVEVEYRETIDDRGRTGPTGVRKNDGYWFRVTYQLAPKMLELIYSGGWNTDAGTITVTSKPARVVQERDSTSRKSSAQIDSLKTSVWIPVAPARTNDAWGYSVDLELTLRLMKWSVGKGGARTAEIKDFVSKRSVVLRRPSVSIEEVASVGRFVEQVASAGRSFGVAARSSSRGRTRTIPVPDGQIGAIPKNFRVFQWLRFNPSDFPWGWPFDIDARAVWTFAEPAERTSTSNKDREAATHGTSAYARAVPLVMEPCGARAVALQVTDGLVDARDSRVVFAPRAAARVVATHYGADGKPMVAEVQRGGTPYAKTIRLKAIAESAKSDGGAFCEWQLHWGVPNMFPAAAGKVPASALRMVAPNGCEVDIDTYGVADSTIMKAPIGGRGFGVGRINSVGGNAGVVTLAPPAVPRPALIVGSVKRVTSDKGKCGIAAVHVSNEVVPRSLDPKRHVVSSGAPRLPFITIPTEVLRKLERQKPLESTTRPGTLPQVSPGVSPLRLQGVHELRGKKPRSPLMPSRPSEPAPKRE